MLQLPEFCYDGEEEFHLRYALAIPTERKLEIARQFWDLAKSRGATDRLIDVLDFLESDEKQLLVHMIGKTFPISDDEFTEAFLLLFLSCGKSAEGVQVVRWEREDT